MSDSRVFVLYDYLQVAGGAERVALDLTDAWAGSKLVVSRSYLAAETLLDERDQMPICLGGVMTAHMGRVPEALWSFLRRARFLGNADLVVYSGFYAPLAVRHQVGGKKIYYCHTPPRFAYDLEDEYRAALPPLLRPLLSAFSAYLRYEFKAALSQMDHIVANSIHVQSRLRKQVGLESEVVYPPVEVNRFRWRTDEGYFVSLARLEPRKRVDVIIKAFLQMRDQHLVVVSGGSQLDKLRELANGAPNIHFTGWQSERQLERWIGCSRAAIYLPADEDFGMSPVEAMAAGKPVIGVAEGGLLETIVDNETGVLIALPPTPELIIEAVMRINRDAFGMREFCERRASFFSKDIFLDRMRAIAAQK